MGKHIVHSTQKEYVDEETGELKIIETSKTHVVKTNEEEFFMTYVKLLKSFYDLEHLADVKLLVKLCELAEFNTGKVSLSTGRRKEVCDELGINTTNFSKYIKRLKDKGLISGDKGEFQINPAIYWKGGKKERAELLKSGGLSVTFNFEA